MTGAKATSRWLEREDRGEVTVVRLRAAKVLNEETTRAVFDPVYSLAGGMGRNRLVLNLAPAQYLPSLALGKLVLLNRKVQAAGGRLALCQLSPAVAETLEATHLADLFDVYATEDDALRSFA
jgi:anti-sigma B factor antagonist